MCNYRVQLYHTYLTSNLAAMGIYSTPPVSSRMYKSQLPLLLQENLCILRIRQDSHVPSWNVCASVALGTWLLPDDVVSM